MKIFKTFGDFLRILTVFDTWYDPGICWHDLDQILVTSDGGFRSSTLGLTAAWIAWRVDVDNNTLTPLAFESTFWINGQSAFAAEVIALDNALIFLISNIA